MSTLQEQFSAARKSQVEAQLTFFQNFTAKAVESTEQMLALNLATTRASMEQSSAAVRQLLTAREPGDLLAVTRHSHNQVQSLLAYGRALAGIATGAQAALLPVVAKAAETALPALQAVAQETAAADAIADAVELAAVAEREYAPEVKAEPEPLVAQSAPAAPPTATVTPMASAVSQTASKAAPATPAAAPLPTANSKVVVTGLKAVEAAPPVAEPKQQELPGSKAKKKK